MQANINGRVYNRSDSSTNWNSNNPILGIGEIAYETDTGMIKIGDGITAYKLLKHYGGSSGIAADGSTTTVAQIPFAQGISVENSGIAFNSGGVTYAQIRYDSATDTLYIGTPTDVMSNAANQSLYYM